ncbi:Sfi1 spindle body protein-domain-containing protein [Paraphoma chrysanthemicola]|uniref:Sfi1 spindle body protein-domain-containing protein n=1 Tax=Paraphoma chrysanthemicola TaxID=798071 RepID=A0A8K0VVV0_9PLEO|nr:Sfi1 spindle body protein-domain-containing protein [Paraphoma chrysanthemicola]
MLPPMSRGGDDADSNVFLKDELTDGAIETLYEIIRRAQTTGTHDVRALKSAHSSRFAKPTSPSSSALFKAYEQVLDEQGLQPSDDAVLHRFLFRMQEGRRHDEGLVQRFKRVLGDMGIEIEVDEEGEGVEVTTNLDKTRDLTRSGAVAALGRHSRRSSFDSFFDGTADKVAGTDYGDLPLRPRSGLDWNGRRVRSDTEAQSYQQAHLPVRNRINGNAHRRTTSAQQHPRPKRSASVSSRGSLQIRRDGRTGTSRAGAYDADDSEHTDHTTDLDLSHIQVPGLNAPIPDISHNSSQAHQQYAIEPFRPSDTRLMDDAELFEEQRLHRVTRDCLQTWRNRMQERQSLHDDMERLAMATYDRKMMRVALDVLLDTMRVRRANRETDRFFHRLEERADRARNLFLLTKAFTHWAKSAEDEVQRTSVARRHILRTRFFNGWREITAVNELKTQHFVLAKFLRQWRNRAAAVRENAQFAVALYEENLVHRVYKEWFFKFCAIAAPAWRNDRIRKIALHKMNEIAKVLRERQEWATDRWERGIVRKTFQTWRERTTQVQALDPRAVTFRQTTSLSSAFDAIRKQAQLAPLLRQFQERVASRVIRTTFQNWQRTAQLSRQARDVDRLRILRNAYTAWNDRLRVKALEERINDRLVVESLYKWTLASRVSLFQRVHARQVKETTFLKWVTKTNERNNTLDAAERRFAQFKRAQLLRTCLRKMEAITAEKRAEEFAVVAEYQQKLKQRIFDKLKERQEHFLQLNKWAGDARFYVLSTRTLKAWSEATQHSRRNRRRDTYAQVRRTVKTNLVRRLFVNWRDKTNHVAQLEQQANDLVENRTLQRSAALLDQWHDRTITLVQQDAQATNIHAFKLETRFLRVWSERYATVQTMDSQAIALRQESAELVATSALKKLGWRLWNIQRQEENARALYERNFEKHVRAMIRFWAEQTNERLANRPISPTPTSRSRRSRRDDDGDNDQGDRDGRDERSQNDGDGPRQSEAPTSPRGLGDWTAFDDNALGLDSELDLSLSITPDHHNNRQSTFLPPSSTRQPTFPPPSSSRQPTLPPPSSARPLPARSILRPTPARPNTYPQPLSALRPPPQTIPEDSILDPAFAAGLDRDLADPETFWSGTPMGPPPPSRSIAPSNLGKSTLGMGPKPGYLKTPSKKSVVRAKRPELPPSPEKRERVVSPVRRDMGAMSAPPAQRNVAQTGLGGFAARGGGLTSFQRRLREGGFSQSVAGPRSGAARGGGNEREKRVGFGDVSQMQ